MVRQDFFLFWAIIPMIMSTSFPLRSHPTKSEGERSKNHCLATDPRSGVLQNGNPEQSHWLMLCNNIMGKQLLEMFKRGSVFPFRTWTQKPTHQSLELPWKTVAQRSKYSTNSWTELLESLPLLSTSFSYWKLLPIIWPSFHSLDKLIPDYNFQRVSCTIP